MAPNTIIETKSKRCNYPLSQKEVASVCNVSPFTLRKNMKRLLSEMDAKSVVEIFKE